VGGLSPPQLSAQQCGPFNRKPIGDIQIRVFQDNGTVTDSTTRTDAAGKAVISLQGRGKFLLSAVHMQEAPPEGAAKWESCWASLTFEIRR
jgi:hypothetical protein